MPDRSYVYRVEIDARQAAAQATRVKSIFQRELSQIQVNPAAQIRGFSAGGIGAPRLSGSNRELIPGFGDLGNLAGYSVAGVAITQLGRQVVDTTVALTEQGTALRRANFTARELAGSTERLSGLMQVYQQVTGGVQTEGESLVKLNSLMAVGFADNERELRRFLTAARGADIATGRGLDYIIGQLQLSIANQSTMRLDQIGLGVEETQQRIEELKTTMPELTTEARYQEAVLGLLNEKYGSLVTSAEAGASGLELFRKEMRELREEAARNVEQATNPFFEAQAVRMGSQNTQAQIRQLRRMAEFSGNPLVAAVTRDNADQLWAFHRAASLLEEVDAAARKGEQGAEALRAKVQALATDMVTGGQATSAQIAQLDELERVYRLTANGGIVYADAMDEASQAAARLATAQEILNSTFAEAQSLLRASYQGTTFVNLPGVGLQPEQGPQLPSDDYLRQRSIMQGGGFLTPGGASVGDIRSVWGEKWRRENEQATRDGIREREQAERAAIRSAESAWKQAANATERAFRNAASELESSIRSIPGLFGASSVTDEQMKMAELGVPQNFADNYLRRLTDEVLNGVDWEGVDIADAARRAGIDQALAPEAILAIFQQKWADQSLFANAANLDLFDQDAIRAEMERQRQSKLGGQNILSMFGLGEDSDGAFFTGLGRGLTDGAQPELQQFALDAVQTIRDSMTGDAASRQWADIGASIAPVIATGLEDAVGQTDIVGIITAAVMAHISAMYEDGA